jgi:hypothetical protein
VRDACCLWQRMALRIHPEGRRASPIESDAMGG